MIPPGTDLWDALLLPEYDKALADARRDFNLPGLRNLVESRYRDGERIHKRDWLTRPLTWFDQMAAEEIADRVAYGAMRRVRVRMLEQEWEMARGSRLFVPR